MSFVIVDAVGGKAIFASRKKSEDISGTLPRFVRWEDLQNIPAEGLVDLVSFANSIEYMDSQNYNDYFDLNFLNSTPDWIADQARALDIGEDDLIIDYATGTGAARLALLKNGYRNVFGVDQSEDCLQNQHNIQEKLGIINHSRKWLITTQELDTLRANLSGEISLIVISSALHHVIDPRSLFIQFSGLLKRGGKVLVVNEPSNKLKYRGATGDNNLEVDLFEVANMMHSNEMKKTLSTTMLSEFWDSTGFGRKYISDVVNLSGLRLTSWLNTSWLSYLALHHVRKHVKPEKKQEFDEVYSKLCDIDAVIRDIATDNFVTENYFGIMFVAEK